MLYIYNMIKSLKYLTPFTVFATAWISFHNTGILTFIPVFYGFVLIPLIELFIKPRPENLSAAEEELVKADKTYDLILYISVPMQYFFLFTFLRSFSLNPTDLTGTIGRTLSMGLLCGVFGINVAHELGHRVNKVEQAMAKLLLLTSQYIHFFIEHNKGHHKNVATPEDPSSARYNESVFAFYPRTILNGYLSAWRIANTDQKKKGRTAFNFRNEMLQAQILQLLFLLLIFYVFDWKILLCYLGAAFFGIMMLENVNYIEHYGLSRNKSASGLYERAMPHHSWNSNHVIGRLMLFELSRHSDHHYLASRKYQILRHHDNAPQMPTGYPGMMLLAHIPPIWFKIMNKKIAEIKPAS